MDSRFEIYDLGFIVPSGRASALVFIYRISSAAQIVNHKSYIIHLTSNSCALLMKAGCNSERNPYLLTITSCRIARKRDRFPVPG